MDSSLNLLLQQLLDGQSAIERRLVTIETTLAEKRGERRVAMWALSGAGGVIGALVTTAAKSFLHK